MAFEDMTYEYIIKRMVDRVLDKYPNLDSREGSIIFNAEAPAAMELSILYTEVENALKESFVQTASREYLLIGCDQMGMDISVFEATAGVHLGVFNVEVPIGSRWNCDLYNYTVIEYIGTNDEGYYLYRMQCETYGTAPNKQTGNLIAITDAPANLTFAQVTECLIEGENETSDEDIRASYIEHVKNVDSDGNVAQYKKWFTDYPGVGNFKIFPLWDGHNTVKVSILSASNQIATQDLIDECQEWIDPGITGMGDGQAPIGAFVTISTATELPISVSGTIGFAKGYTLTETLDNALRNYFNQIAYETSQVAYINVGAALLDVEGVEYVGSDLKLNGAQDNIKLGDEQIPVLGTTSWTVV